MNTNLLITLAFTLATNWTGYVDSGKELGVVKSNTVAQITYEGKLHELLLKSEDTGWHVWRDAPTGDIYFESVPGNYGQLILTNFPPFLGAPDDYIITPNDIAIDEMTP